MTDAEKATVALRAWLAAWGTNADDYEFDEKLVAAVAEAIAKERENVDHFIDTAVVTYPT